MKKGPTRRQILSSGSAISGLFLAGCVNFETNDDQSSDDSTPESGLDNVGVEAEPDEYDPGVVRENAKYVPYNELNRAPESYVGEPIHYPWGEVVQAFYDDVDSFRINVGESPEDRGDDIFAVYDGDGRLIENDNIKLWGVVEGKFAYETVLGSERVIPEITLVDYEEFDLEEVVDLNFGISYRSPEDIVVTVIDLSLEEYYEYEDFQGNTAKEEASEGMQWCFISVDAMNDSGSSEWLPRSRDFVIMANGDQFDSESIYDDLVGRTDEEYEGGEVLDGVSRTGWIAFEIPSVLNRDDIIVIWSDSTYYQEWTVKWTESS